MKKRFIAGLSSILMSAAISQPASADYLYGLDAWEENLLWIIDPADGSTIGAHQVNLDSGNIDTQNGMAVDPTTGDMYAVIAVNSNFNRTLMSLDPETGNATSIGTLAVPFAAIVFDENGTLYGASGNSNSIAADDRNALFEIDPTDASITRICKFANTNQGHALAYGDGLLYHAQSAGQNWSGATILESMDPQSFPVTSTDPCPITNIPLDYDGGDLFIHPMSMLVTATGTGTATILLSGWQTAGSCCIPDLFSIAVDSGNAEASDIGDPDSFFKGMAFHSFEPASFASTNGLSVTKTAFKYRNGNERHVQFTLEVFNESSETLTGITLTDYLDTSKIAYNTDNFGCDLPSGAEVSCDLGSIDPFSSETVVIDTRVACKGKNCQSVQNQAFATVSLDQWVDNPFGATRYSPNIGVDLKGKY
jgi:hypothetical protein